MNITVNEHIQLSEFREVDKPALLEYLNDLELYERTLMIPYPYTVANAEAWLALVDANTARQGQPVQFAIRNRDGKLIGSVGFDGLTIGESHRAEIGYWLARGERGKGIVTAVVRRVCDFAFAEWGLVKITTHIFSFNDASARVLEKCGFEQEGYLKRHYLKDGKYLDARVYSLLK